MTYSRTQATIPFKLKCSIFIFIIIYLNRNAWYGPKSNKSKSIPLTWSSKNKMPETNDFIWVGEFYPFYRWDCDMYLSWPAEFNKDNHPGPSFKWSMEVYNEERVKGMNCVVWDEPFDRDTWNDNAMCLPKDSKFEMKFISDLEDKQGWDLESDCISVDRPGQSDNEGWWNNYFCVRQKEAVE